MLTALAATRALRAPQAARALLGQGARAGASWGGILHDVSPKTSFTASLVGFGGPDHRKDERGRQGGRSLVSFRPLPPSKSEVLHLDLVKNRTKFSIIAGTFAARAYTAAPGPGAAVAEEPFGSGGFALLAAAHATLAVTAFMAPTAVANVFFPGTALPQGMQTQALIKLLGSGLAAGAASCYALKQAADAGALASPVAQRLQLGLMAFSSSAIALHLIYSPAITMASLLSGAAVMGATFAVPYQTYRRAVGAVKPLDAVKRYVGAVPDHLRITGVQSGMYSLLTPTLALAGLAYVGMPGDTLAAAFG